MHFIIEKHIDAPVEAVWPLIAVPERISTWSGAPVRLLSPGDGGHPGTTGAMRAVELTLAKRPKRIKTKLIEVVERGEAPNRLHYRLVAGYPVLSHRGEVELSEGRGGTDLRWEVRAELGAGLDGFVGKRIHAQLDRSLDRLHRHVGAPAVGPTLTAIEEPSDALWRQARELLVMQQERAARLRAENEPRSWFARIYSIVTDRLIAQAEAGAYVHPAWLLRLIPIFERFYAENLDAYLAGRRGDVESHWARAFRYAEIDGPEAIGTGIIAGITAHVEGDLGRALGEVYARHYAEVVDYVRFRADYYAMQSIFHGAAETMLAEVPRQATPLWFRIVRKTFPPGLVDLIRDRTFYDMALQRRRAFEEGARIARLLTRA